MRRWWFAPWLVALLAAGGCDIVTAGRIEQTAEWHKTYTLAPGGTVEIGDVNGKIVVEPSTGNTVEVTALKKARGASDEAAKAQLDRITFSEDVGPSRVRVEAKFPRSQGIFLGGGGGTVEFHVRVPAAADGRFATTNGAVEVSDLAGRVHAETTNGGVTARNMSGQLDARTTNGGLTIDLAKMPEDGVRLSCTNGGIRVRLPRDAKATISASITNGGISAGDLPIDSTGETSRRRLEGRMNGGGPRLEIEGTNGGISLSSR